MSEQTNNPPKKRVTSGAFKKGDPRINRKGRPKSFEALRKEAIKLAGEIIQKQTESGEPMELSRIHAILLDWAGSDDPRKQQMFVEYAFGKVPNKEEISGAGGNELTVRYVNDWRNPTANPTHRPDSGDEGGTPL